MKSICCSNIGTNLNLTKLGTKWMALQKWDYPQHCILKPITCKIWLKSSLIFLQCTNRNAKM